MKKGYMMIMCLILCFVYLGTFGCSKTLPKETRGSDSVVSVKSEDEAMNSIIEQARQSVNDFLKELNNQSTKGSDFAIKYPFKTDPGSKYTVEHIWLANIEQVNGKYFGIVSNDPFYIKQMKIGDKVEFDISEISDWKYVENGYLVGGKSIVYFYNQMSDQEKADFEKEAGFKIR